MKIPLTQGLFAEVDITDYEYLNQWKWYAKSTRKKGDPDGIYYAAHSQRFNDQVTTIYMHRVITACPDNKEIDHINMVTLDNHRKNLRVCDRVKHMAHKNHCNAKN